MVMWWCQPGKERPSKSRTPNRRRSVATAERAAVWLRASRRTSSTRWSVSVVSQYRGGCRPSGSGRSRMRYGRAPTSSPMPALVPATVPA